MTTFHFGPATILFASLVAMPVTANAQGVNIGKNEFMNSCAVCHGTGGKGDGPLAKVIDKKVADLTVLQKNNKGVFPFNRVYNMIDGRELVAAHGTREMPAWGSAYKEEAVRAVPYEGTESIYAASVRGRILALIAYISTLQAK